MSGEYKTKGIVRRALGYAFNSFEGTGIGKIPGVFWMFSRIASVFGGIYKEVDGQKLRAIVTPQKKLLYCWDGYEKTVSSLFCSMLEEGMVVVDIGASIGYYTLLAAKRVGANGKVISFEPDLFRFEGLMDNIQINGWKNIQAFQVAVSDREGERKIESGESFAIRNAKYAIAVNTICLDSFLQNDPDIVKIDIEGAELEALNGMREILKKGKVKILCEVHPDLLSSLGYQTKEIEDILREYDFNIYLIGEKGLLPATSISNKREHYLFTREKTI